MSCIWKGLQLQRCSIACWGIATVYLTVTITVKQKRLMAFGCFIQAHSGTALTADRDMNYCTFHIILIRSEVSIIAGNAAQINQTDTINHKTHSRSKIQG